MKVNLIQPVNLVYPLTKRLPVKTTVYLAIKENDKGKIIDIRV